MHGWMIYPHRIKNLCLPLPNVDYRQEPVDVVVIDGDDHFVQIKDIEMRCPPTDIVEGVSTIVSQLAVKICVGHPAFGSTGGLWCTVCSTSANTLAPPLKPKSDHFAAKPCCVLEAFEFFEGDIQAIPLCHQSLAGEALLQQGKQFYFHPALLRQFNRSTLLDVIMTGDVSRLIRQSARRLI
jgi:hypothetical protein